MSNSEKTFKKEKCKKKEKQDSLRSLEIPIIIGIWLACFLIGGVVWLITRVFIHFFVIAIIFPITIIFSLIIHSDFGFCIKYMPNSKRETKKEREEKTKRARLKNMLIMWLICIFIGSIIWLATGDYSFFVITGFILPFAVIIWIKGWYV